MTEIDTTRVRAEFVQTPYSQVDVTISALCDEIDRLRRAIQSAIDLVNDDENQDEMSSDAQEWCAEVTSILNKAMS